VLLVAIGVFIAVEAIRRLVSPHPVTGSLVLVVAVSGAVINLIVVRVLARANRQSLNIRSAFVHVVTDLYAFVGTAVSGLIVMITHWVRADSIASLLVVVLMLWTARKLLGEAGNILLQGAPDDLDLGAVRVRLAAVEHVLDIHDLHAWTLTSGSTTLSAHVIVQNQCFDTGHAPQILDALQSSLASEYGITHSTFQLEPLSHVSHEDDIHH
jgi:cobalt-zinc-cadmium efflux system protein